MKAPAEKGEPEPHRSTTAHRAADERRAQPVAARLPAARMSATSARRLQRSAGNRATAKVLGRPAVQRLESAPEAAPRPSAEADPRFASVEAEVRGKQKQIAAHPPATAEAAASQAAAVAPPDDKLAQGKAANAEKMNAAKPGEFDKAAFIRAVEQAIAAQAPKNLDDADKFGESGKADAVKGQVQGQVGQGKAASAGPIETATNAPPDTAAATDKPVTPLAPDRPPGTPAAPDAANAVPQKAPASATDFSDGPKQVDGEMAAAQVTDDQLAKSNEPEFTGALRDKQETEQHAATAPGQVRGAEAQTLAGAKADAAGAGRAAMAGLAAERGKAGGKVTEEKQGTKGKDEARRAQVTATLQKVFDATKTDVEAILSGLDKKVDDAFTAGEKAARDAFTAEHKQKMDAYKDKRYSGFTGKLKWVKDKFAGLPEEANQIFVAARQGYVAKMRGVISSVADIIGGELNRAKARIATGREQLQAEVRKLPEDLRALGKQAAGDLAGKFDELTESVDAKGTELVQTLATKYNEALKSVDAEIEAEKEKNKGLVAKAIGAIKGVIDTILKLKDLLLGILAKAAAAVMGILRDPIGFLGNLVSAVGAGLRAFIGNIGEHLKKGLVGWLMGAMAGAGLQLPAKFDLRGIIMMIGSLLGLTWAAIRGRIVARGVPEPAMAAAEGAVPIAQKIKSEGVGGIWETIKEKAGDLKATLFGKLAEYLIPTVLVAGITMIVSMLNPASAFVRAVKMIIDLVTFIVTQGAQIIQFINAVLDAIVAIAGGSGGGVPALIENALALSIPVLIGALAAIAGVTGIADKVKKIIQSLAKPIMKAVDWVVDKIAGIAKKLWAKLKGKFGNTRDRLRGGDDSPEGKRRRLDAARKTVERALEKGVRGIRLKAVLAGIKVRYGLRDLRVEDQGGKAKIVGEVNPTFELFADKIPLIDRTVEGDDSEALMSTFRSMSLRSVLRIFKGQNLGIKKDDQGRARGEPGFSENYLYAVHYVERKQKDQRDISKYHYAVMIEIEFAAGGLAELMHGSHGAMDHGTANKLENDGEGVIVDRGKPGRFFVFHEKRPELPKEILIYDGGRNKLVFKLERSHQPGVSAVANYLVISKESDDEQDVATKVNAYIRRVSVIGGVKGQVTADVVRRGI
ncbi:Skp family chaperone for outer membrane proteins [Actinokineospora baliensis]|uniref:hypothetical protein n=1 Tax=Actinokineospora baliensis TaxID=547056 RepID=UPI00195DF9F4|nr:hypothetical protein [Actinokineospora baliensis]MBM7773837.1 Skp family chaperone for outer membrane proteins [Actinokineospora baliensis]